MIRKLFLCVVVLALFSSLFLIQSASAKLVAAWLFDENSGATAKDSVSSIVGNIKGGVVWDTGKFKSALKFDGKSGQVDIPDPKNVLTPKNITIAAWLSSMMLPGSSPSQSNMIGQELSEHMRFVWTELRFSFG